MEHCLIYSFLKTRFPFSEAFVGGYPKALSFGISLGKRSDGGRDEFKNYFESAIEYDSRESERIAKIAKRFKVYLVVGVVERDGGTLYCSVSTAFLGLVPLDSYF